MLIYLIDNPIALELVCHFSFRLTLTQLFRPFQNILFSFGVHVHQTSVNQDVIIDMYLP